MDASERSAAAAPCPCSDDYWWSGKTGVLSAHASLPGLKSPLNSIM